MENEGKFHASREDRQHFGNSGKTQEKDYVLKRFHIHYAIFYSVAMVVNEPTQSFHVKNKDKTGNIIEATLSDMTTDGNMPFRFHFPIFTATQSCLLLDELDERTEKQNKILDDDVKLNHFLFSPVHPLYQTHGHRKRKRRVWPQFRG